MCRCLLTCRPLPWACPLMSSCGRISSKQTAVCVPALLQECQIPIYAIKGGNVPSLTRAFRTLLGLDPSAGACVCRGGDGGRACKRVYLLDTHARMRTYAHTHTLVAKHMACVRHARHVASDMRTLARKEGPTVKEEGGSGPGCFWLWRPQHPTVTEMCACRPWADGPAICGQDVWVCVQTLGSSCSWPPGTGAVRIVFCIAGALERVPQRCTPLRAPGPCAPRALVCHLALALNVCICPPATAGGSFVQKSASRGGQVSCAWWCRGVCASIGE